MGRLKKLALSALLLAFLVPTTSGCTIYQIVNKAQVAYDQAYQQR